MIHFRDQFMTAKLRHLYNIDHHKSSAIDTDNGALRIEDTLHKINSNINQVLNLIGQSRSAIGQSANNYLSRTSNTTNLSSSLLDTVEMSLENKKKKYLGGKEF